MGFIPSATCASAPAAALARSVIDAASGGLESSVGLRDTRGQFVQVSSRDWWLVCKLFHVAGDQFRPTRGPSLQAS